MPEHDDLGVKPYAMRPLAFVDKIVFQDRHLKLEGPIVVFIVDKQDADKLLTDVDLSGIILLRTRHDTNFGIAEQTLEIRVEFPDFLNVHGCLQIYEGCQLLLRDMAYRYRFV